jgi:ectoine hydroxylase-related dioxygenase (phytanoyl-CoA dioxygenase family)
MAITADHPFSPPVADTEIGRKFAEDGFYLAKGVFNATEVAELERDFDRIVDQLVASGENNNATWSGPEMERLEAQKLIVLHTHNVQRYSAAWMRAMMHPKFLAVTADIIGPDIILHHSKLFQKPSEKGAPFPMHQDWDYFPTVKDSMIAGVIHVSRADDEMGCLRVYPGSHKLGRVDQSGGQFENEILRDYPLENATPVEAEPGDVVFFHYFTIHGSMPNRSSEIRKTVLVQVHSGEDRVEDMVQHPNEMLVLSGWNHHATRNSVNLK